jgi:hypothetical protein
MYMKCVQQPCILSSYAFIFLHIYNQWWPILLQNFEENGLQGKTSELPEEK